MDWFVEANVPGAEYGMRAIVDGDGYTVCNPSPMGEYKSRLIADAPALLKLAKMVLDYANNPAKSADKWVALAETLVERIEGE